MLSEETAVDRIEVLEHGHIQVRRANRVLRDGEVISTQFHRVAYAPGDDVSHEDARIRAIAAAAWSFVQTEVET